MEFSSLCLVVKTDLVATFSNCCDCMEWLDKIGKRRLSYKLSAAFLPIVFALPISVLLSFSMKKKF